MRQRIGLMSLPPPPAEAMSVPFDAMLGRAGCNTGNLVFTAALSAHLPAETTRVAYEFEPQEVNSGLDRLVISAANWINSYDNWDWLSDKLDAVEVPIVVVGLGMQSHTVDPADSPVNESCRRLVEVLRHKRAHVAARGRFTQRWLESAGVRNAEATGCPSLYMRFAPAAPRARLRYVAIQSTRYRMTPEFIAAGGTHLDAFRLAGRLGLDMIYQSEPEEMEYLLRGEAAGSLPALDDEAFRTAYGIRGDGEVRRYLERSGHCFFRVDRWARHLAEYVGQLGTRLHGAILALNHGVTAVLWTHDSRTRELADFAGIPVAERPPSSVTSLADVQELLDEASDAPFVDRRRRNAVVYRQFMQSAGLELRTENLLS